MGLIIRSSSIHAAGCYTTQPISKGTLVVEYTGPRIHKDRADAKYQDSPTTYLFGIGDGTTVIDGHGTAMFINHSCHPNCETEEIDGRIWIMAIRPIAAGDELTYEYNLYDGEEDEGRCNCGAPTCRKTMYAAEEKPAKKTSKKLAKKPIKRLAKKPIKRLAKKPIPPLAKKPSPKKLAQKSSPQPLKKITKKSPPKKKSTQPRHR